MSQGTPRKFSEKIAIMERKQNEDQEAFTSVMRDVRAITSACTSHASPSPSALAPPMHWNRPGGSLPNVHEMVQQQQLQPGPQNCWPFWPGPQLTPHHTRARSPGQRLFYCLMSLRSAVLFSCDYFWYLCLGISTKISLIRFFLNAQKVRALYCNSKQTLKQKFKNTRTNSKVDS